MLRPVLEESRVHPAVRERVARHFEDTVRQVQDAVSRHAVVVVGMATNPWCRRVRKDLSQAGVAHEYLEFGSYVSEWRRRNALKMWTGWPTLPMVFVKGTLVGGAQDVAKLIANGELKKLLA